MRFPFTSQIKSKQRPAVAISNRAYNDARPDIVLMAITTNLDPEFGLVQIKEWRTAGLFKPSAVKPIFATIEQTLIVRELGHLQADDKAAVRTAISEMLGS